MEHGVLDHNTLETLLWALGGLNTLFWMVASYTIAGFRRAVDRLERTDFSLAKRVTRLEIGMAQLQENATVRTDDIKRVLEKLDALERSIQDTAISCAAK